MIQAEKLLIIFSTLLCFKHSNFVFADEAKFMNGVAHISTKSLDNRTIDIQIKTTKFLTSFPHKNGLGWGADTEPNNQKPSYPKSIVTMVNVKVGKEIIFVPLSAYCDLANPASLSFALIPNGFRLTLVGGDASTSYQAELDFDYTNIKRRKVFSGEFPDELWEETVYSFVVDRGQ